MIEPTVVKTVSKEIESLEKINLSEGSVSKTLSFWQDEKINISKINADVLIRIILFKNLVIIIKSKTKIILLH